MNIIELEQFLKENNIPEYYYNLYGIGRNDERLVLIQNDNKWQVFYLERGIKTTDLFFNTESDACKYIADELVKRQIKRLFR